MHCPLAKTVDVKKTWATLVAKRWTCAAHDVHVICAERAMNFCPCPTRHQFSHKPLSTWSGYSTLRFRGLAKYCVFPIKTDVVVKWDSTLRFRGLPKYCVFTIKTHVTVKWKCFQFRKRKYIYFLSLKAFHFTVTWVLIVKTQYFATPRNRKVESHFTTTSFLIVKTQYFGSPRNRKVKTENIEVVRTQFLIVKKQYFGSRDIIN